MKLELVSIGMGLVIIGMLLLMIGSVIGKEETDIEYGGLIMIGPIPIAFGSSKGMIITALIIGIILICAILVLSYLVR